MLTVDDGTWEEYAGPRRCGSVVFGGVEAGDAGVARGAGGAGGPGLPGWTPLEDPAAFPPSSIGRLRLTGQRTQPSSAVSKAGAEPSFPAFPAAPANPSMPGHMSWDADCGQASG